MKTAMIICCPFSTLREIKIPCSKILLFLFLLLIFDIVGFFLTYINYSENIKIYAIIRFVSQGLYIYYCFTLLLLLNYPVEDDGSDMFVSFGPYCCMLLIMIALEIVSLVFYIKTYDEIVLSAKIGYYIHFLNIIENIICFSFVFCH